MSGHNKWSTIKHKKGAADAARGKVFTKLIKEITVAARSGGDIESNAKLRSAVVKARGANMPKDNIDRAIKKGTGELGGAEYVELVYEGYAPGGVGLIIETLTDNRNRTGANVKALLSKNGGELAATGAVSFQFKRMGVIVINGEVASEDKVMEVVLDAGAEDVSSEDDMVEVTVDPAAFEAVLNALERAGIATESAAISMIVDEVKGGQTVTLDKDKTQRVLNLIEKIEDDDDVQTVSSNLEIPSDMELD